MGFQICNLVLIIPAVSELKISARTPGSKKWSSIYLNLVGTLKAYGFCHLSDGILYIYMVIFSKLNF
jgi:hypothetical protein